MTPTRWLFDKLWEEPKDKFTWYALLGQAEDMEREQMKQEYLSGCESAEERLQKEIDKIHEYYRSHRTT